MRIVFPSTRISWISTMPAAGLSTPTRVAPSVLLSCMKAPVDFCPGTVPRTHASDAVTCACATATALTAATAQARDRANGRIRLRLLFDRSRDRAPLVLQHVAREVFARGEFLEFRVDVGGVDPDRRRPAASGGERDVLEQLLHHRVEPARADVLGLLVHSERGLGEALDPVRPEFELHALGLEQRLV